MAENLDGYARSVAVRNRLGLIGDIECALDTHPDEIAVAIGDGMEVARVLTGRIPAETPEEKPPFSNTVLSIVSLADAGNPLTQVRVKGVVRSQQEYDMRPPAETLGELTSRHSTLDALTRLMLEYTVFSAELSSRTLELLKKRPDLLGLSLGPRMRIFGGAAATDNQPSIPQGNPRILSRRGSVRKSSL